ncbi:hypothetical protein KR009_004590 [Drosophila setifemur]|nr:hypothetical protein KR009_004590 [Drosophila setifemur]
MYPNWPVLLHLMLACLGVGGQMFAQPLTKKHGVLAIQRAEGQMIEEADLHHHLQQITGSEALAPLLLGLLGQNVPNWQQQQQQRQQQKQQAATNQPHRPQEEFFVYKNPLAASQQPQILPGFNGVNVQPEQPTQQQQQQQHPLAQPIQAQQQYPPAGPKIVKAPPGVAVWAPELSHPSSITSTTPASCQLSQSQPLEGATPCPPTTNYQLVPLLSATALKATVG